MPLPTYNSCHLMSPHIPLPSQNPCHFDHFPAPPLLNSMLPCVSPSTPPVSDLCGSLVLPREQLTCLPFPHRVFATWCLLCPLLTSQSLCQLLFPLPSLLKIPWSFVPFCIPAPSYPFSLWEGGRALNYMGFKFPYESPAEWSMLTVWQAPILTNECFVRLSVAAMIAHRHPAIGLQGCRCGTEVVPILC